MSSMSEHLEVQLRELERVGITPTIEPTQSGHVWIKWQAGDKRRAIVTSKTPSDHRSTLNCRARIRALLRLDGLFDKPKGEAGVLAKALSAPAPRDPDNVRIRRLEEDLGALLDIIADMTNKLTAHGISVDYEKPVELTLPAAASPAVVKAQRKLDMNWRHDFLLCVEYGPTLVSTIIRRAGCTAGNASVRLATLKKEGLVENVARGVWRKVRKIGNGNGTSHAGEAVHGAIVA